MPFYLLRYIRIINPTMNMIRPNYPPPMTPVKAYEEENNTSEKESESSHSCWTKTLTVVGSFFVVAFIVAAIIVPLYLVPLLTATTTTVKSTTTTTTTTMTTSTSTTTTTIVTLYVPSNYFTACAAACTNVTTTSTASSLLASWDFENNLHASSSTYNGDMNSSTTYISGYISQALVVNGADYVTITSYLSFANQSFTIEVWIYLTSLNSSVDTGIFGQCQNTTPDYCLHLVIRSNKVYMGFFGDDVSGITNISTHVWTHVAFTYDLTTNTKSVYLNGILENFKTTGTSYRGTNGVTYIGYATHGSAVNPLSGYIDQVTISNRAKTDCEILNDATLVSHFSFDNIITDVGPNALPSYCTVQGNSGVSYTNGSVNRGLLLSTTNAFFQSCGYYALAISNQPFSFALWINPTVIGGTKLHLSTDQSGSGRWCLPFIGFSSNGSIVAQSWINPAVSVNGPQIPTNNWTHIVQTWSSTNGLQLYVNGALYGSSVMATYNAAGHGYTMCIYLGTSGFGTNCNTGNIVMGTFSGAFDEFYVYNRELNASEICSLAHP